MYADPHQCDAEPHHDASATHAICSDLELYGYRHSENDPDPRDVPEDRTIAVAVSDIFDALVATMADTSLDADLDEMLWSTVNMFHRATDRIERKLDDNEQAQKTSPARTGRLRSKIRPARTSDCNRSIPARPT